MSILTSLDWARFFFDVLAIESQYSSEDNDAIQRFLSDRGYDIWGAIWDEKGLNAEEEGKTRANNWFVRRGFQPSHGPADGTGQAPSPGAHGNIGNTLGSRCGCHSDRSATFWVAGLGERRRLVGTTSRSASTTYVHSVCTRRNPAPLDPRKSRNNVMRCVLVGEEGDGEVMQPARAELQCFHCGSSAARCLCSRRWLRARAHPTLGASAVWRRPWASRRPWRAYRPAGWRRPRARLKPEPHTNGLRIYFSSQPAYVNIPERLGRGDVDLGEGLGGAAACVCALGLVFNAPIGGGAAPPLAPPPPAPACRCTAALCRPVGSRPSGILCHGMLEPDASGISDASTARNQSNGLLRAQRTSGGCAHGVRMWRSGVVRRFDTHEYILICVCGAQKAQGRRGRVAVRARPCDVAFDDIWAYNPHAPRAAGVYLGSAEFPCSISSS